MMLLDSDARKNDANFFQSQKDESQTRMPDLALTTRRAPLRLEMLQ